MRCSSWNQPPSGWLDVENPLLFFPNYFQIEDGSLQFCYLLLASCSTAFYAMFLKKVMPVNNKRKGPKMTYFLVSVKPKGLPLLCCMKPFNSQHHMSMGVSDTLPNGARWGPTWEIHAVDFSFADAPRDGCFLLCCGFRTISNPKIITEVNFIAWIWIIWCIC